MPSGFYYTDDSPVVLNEFPRAERIESSPNERALATISWRRRAGLKHETEEGAYWVFRQANRRVWRLVFRVPETELDTFRDLDDAVDGDAEAFYFVPDVDDSPYTSYLVRKTSDFEPQPIEAQWDGSQILKWYDYTLELTEESEAGQILA